MLNKWTAVLLLLWSITTAADDNRPEVGGSPSDIAAYVGAAGDDGFMTLLPLSDGTILIGGGVGSLDWLPDSTPITTLSGVESADGKSNRFPVLIHVTGDLSEILHVAHLPQGTAAGFRVIKTTSLPGEATGDLFASLSTGGDDYILIRLEGNFVDQPVASVRWSKTIRASRGTQKLHPWDVGSDGKIVYATGGQHGPDWMAINRLTADGQDDTVPHWRRHWFVNESGKRQEHAGSLDSVPGRAVSSGMVLKRGRGDFRSHSREAFFEESSDGNGGIKKGRWPLDAMMSGPFIVGRDTPDLTGTGRGYFGYRWGSPTCGVGAIVVDRRTNQMIIGGNNKSRLPDGNPDFEPWVIAFDADGRLQWWQRLYPESKGVSTPDQYVDAMAIDYTADASPGALFVVARAHGNNVNNFWTGDSIQQAEKPGWQIGFTGNHGNMHFNWIGKMTLAGGEMLAATYLAEYSEGAKHGDESFSNPKLADWPHFRSGWPNLNSTRIEPHGLSIDPEGRPIVVARGRRVITTSDAFMQMPSPTARKGTAGQWSHFVRVYRPDLSDIDYSSQLNGSWDLTTGKGGSNVELIAAQPMPDGSVIAVGTAKYEKKETPKAKDSNRLTVFDDWNENQEPRVPEGDNMPLRNIPEWATDQRTDGDTAVLFRVSWE